MSINKTVQWCVTCDQCGEQEVVDFDTQMMQVINKLAPKGWWISLDKTHYTLCPKCYNKKIGVGQC